MGERANVLFKRAWGAHFLDGGLGAVVVIGMKNDK
jgi:hypothetical protein